MADVWSIDPFSCRACAVEIISFCSQANWFLKSFQVTLLQTIFLECLYHWLIQYYKQLQNDTTIFSYSCPVSAYPSSFSGFKSHYGWLEEPMGLQRVGHCWAHTHTVGLSKSFPRVLHSFSSFLLPFPFLCFPPSLSLFLFVLTASLSPLFSCLLPCSSGFPCGKESTCNVGDLASIPGLGRFPGEGKGYPLQYSGLENFTNCMVHDVAKSWTRLKDFNFHCPCCVLSCSVS